MKFRYMVIIGLILASNVQAEEKRTTNWVVSGTLAYSSHKGDAFRDATGSKGSRLYGTPSAGIFVNRKLALGITSHMDFQSQGDVKNNSFSMGPYLSWNFVAPYSENGSQNRWIPHLGGSWMWGREKYEGAGLQGNSNHFKMLRLEGGVTLLLTESLGLTLSLNRARYFTSQTFEGVDYKLKGWEWGVEYGVTAYVF